MQVREGTKEDEKAIKETSIKNILGGFHPFSVCIVYIRTESNRFSPRFLSPLKIQ